MHMKITSDCVINCHSTQGSTKSFATPTVNCQNLLVKLIKCAYQRDHSKCKAKASDLPADLIRFKKGQYIADKYGWTQF